MGNMDFDTLRYYLRARMFEWLRRYDQAEREYRIALQHGPRSVKVVSALGYLLARRDRYEEALGYFEEAVRLAPKNAHLLFDLGFVREKLRRIEPAIEAFQAAVRLNPKLDRAWYGMGMCYATLGRHEEAVSAFQQAAELQPMNPHAWYALGMAYHHTRNPDKVKEVVHHLFRFDPIMTRQLIRDAQRADLAHLVKDLKV
jgi:tetratricopeptide (TPR) repeat protein